MTREELLEQAERVSEGNHTLMELANEFFAQMGIVMAEMAEFSRDAGVPVMKSQRAIGHAADAQKHLAECLKSVALMDAAGDTYLRERDDLNWDCADASIKEFQTSPLRLVEK